MQTNKKGNIFIISAASGTGKTTLVSRLLKNNGDIRVSISHTTRQPREGERHGVHYHFVSDEDFDSLVATDQMLEWALVHGAHRYGTPRGPVQDELDVGRPALLEIDVAGARQVRRAMPESRLVFLAPPSWEELVRRLAGRGTEGSEEQKRRLATARTELDAVGEFDHVVINDTVASATAELERLMGLGS